MPTIPHLAASTLLLNVQADALTLTDGDPVSTWADLSGNGYDFTQTGSARPTYHTGGGTPYVQFDGIDDWMLGPDFADDLDSFTVFAVYADWQNLVMSKIANEGCAMPGATGWSMYQQNIVLWATADDIVAQSAIYEDVTTERTIWTYEVQSLAAVNMNMYRNGTLTNTNLPTGQSYGAGVTSFSTSEPVRLGIDGALGGCDPFAIGKLSAVMIYAPAPDASDRALIEAWLRYKYGFPIAMLQSDVVAFWGLDEPSGQRADATTNAHYLTEAHGVVASASGIDGDGALFVAANGAYLQTDNTSDLQITASGSYTITAWVKLQSNHNQVIVSKGLSGVYEYRLYWNGLDAFVFEYNGASVTYPAVYSDTQFFFLEASFDVDAGLVKLRVNNDPYTSIPGSSTTGDVGMLSIGGDAANDPTDPAVASAIIDAVCIWRRVLYADDRTLLYAGAVWPFTVSIEVFRSETASTDAVVTIAYDALTNMVDSCTIDNTGGATVLSVDMYKIEDVDLILWQQLIAQPGASVTRTIAAGLTVGLTDGEIAVNGGNMAITVNI